jgi:hypothetical protein
LEKCLKNPAEILLVIPLNLQINLGGEFISVDVKSYHA